MLHKDARLLRILIHHIYITCPTYNIFDNGGEVFIHICTTFFMKRKCGIVSYMHHFLNCFTINKVFIIPFGDVCFFVGDSDVFFLISTLLLRRAQCFLRKIVSKLQYLYF